MKIFGWLGGIVAFVLALLAFNALYVVDQREQAIVLQVGAIVKTVNDEGKDEAGLKYKIPLIQNVVKFDKRNMGLNIPDIEVIASDQEQLEVDAFVRWRISDPLQFYRRLGTERVAQGQLTRFTENAIRDVLGKKLPDEIISGQRNVIMDEIRELLTGEAEDVGISIIDVRIRRADRLPEVNASIFNEMRLAREQEAERIRAEGDEVAAKIRAEAERERTVLLAKAREEAQIIRGNGDAKRNEIYNAAYTQDLNFFNFYRGLEACEEAFPAGSRVVISPDKLNICEDILDSARQSVPARR